MDAQHLAEGLSLEKNELPESKSALTPPTSEDLDKIYGSSSELSELSEPEEEEDDFEIEPDHYWGDGKVPVFKPTMEQFRSFPKFIDKIDKYGMRSGIVKVVPPKEWRENLPALDEMVKMIRVKNPIMQEFNGTHGTYTQANIEKQRSYNLPQWKSLTQELHHQPPAKRGQRRGGEPQPKVRSSRNQTAMSSTPTTSPRSTNSTEQQSKRNRGRPRKSTRNAPAEVIESIEVKEEPDEELEGTSLDVPPTPTSPGAPSPRTKREASRSVKKEATPTKSRGRPSQGKSISSRRMNNQREMVKDVDEKAFKNFSYHLENLDEFTPERCRELEDVYWRTINYGQPMYGADMPGSLFDERTTSWNVAKLENLLDVLGTKVPGVNTAYLYLGMWKATFAWHLEDVDLYSINYIHFGAPKQWYSISQEDARRFEAAMKTMWPAEAKKCDQFLRHKTFLISPKRLESDFGIKVNKLVHYEGEFVITYPYGYHSGFNLGYNCAESVNFATEQWLNYGRIAKKCDCESDSVWVNVAEIERKLRGEPTPEYYEETEEEEEEADEVENDLLTPPASVKGKRKAPIKKRKRDEKKDAGPKKKKTKLRIRIRVPAKEPCILCPNDVRFDELLPTDNGQKAHRLCAQYTIETFISEGAQEKVCNVARIDKARLDLKCNYCRSKRGSCFQCDSKKCTRAYHATCAAAAGVLVDIGPMPYFDNDGQEYFYEGTDFRCRFHRPKRPKNTDGEVLESNKLIKQYAKSLKPKDVVQAQLLTGDIFAGTVVENRPGEGMVVLDVLPDGERVEVEYKYLLVLDPAESQRPKPSSNAKPLPAHLNTFSAEMSEKVRPDGVPEKGDAFLDPNAPQKWEEFSRVEEYAANRYQQKVDLSKSEQIWYYLGKTSTEARPQYTEDLRQQRYNARSNFLDSVKPPPAPSIPKPRLSKPYGISVNTNAYNAAMAAQRQYSQYYQAHRAEKPYQYKPKPGGTGYAPGAFPNAQTQYAAHFSQLQHPAQVSESRPASLQQQSKAQVIQSNQLSDSQRPYQNQVQISESQEVTLLPAAARPIDPNLSKSSSPYQYYHQYYQPRVTQSVNPLYNPYQCPSNSPDLHRRILPPHTSASTAENCVTTENGGSKTGHLNVEEYFKHLNQYPYLRSCYLRRPKQYTSPYASNGGFNPDWTPGKPNDSRGRDSGRGGSQSYASPYGNSVAASNGPNPAAKGLGISTPSLAPCNSNPSKSLQFQTAQQFQQDMARREHHTSNNGISKFEAFIHQLNNGVKHPPEEAKNPVTSATTHSLPPHLVASRSPLQGPISGDSHSNKAYGRTPNQPCHGGEGSPARPEYSPLSDAGSGPGRPPSSAWPPSVAAPHVSTSSASSGPGAESWRFM